MAKKPKLFGKPIGEIIKHPGAFKAKARAAGYSNTCEYAKLKLDAPGILGRQARLANSLCKMSKSK